MKIKVCGMKHNSNISALLALKPDFVGFIFYEKSPRCVGEEAPDILFDSWPSTTKRVGVFVDESIDVILTKARRFSLDFVQLHGRETPETAEQLKNAGLGVIKVFHLKKKDDLTATRSYDTCDYFLFDTPSEHHGGTGTIFDWSLLADYDNHKPYFLSGGIGHDTAIDFEKASIPTPFGLDVNSCFEDSPGIKNIELLTPFIQQVHGL